MQLCDGPLRIARVNHVNKPEPPGITCRNILQHFGLVYRTVLAKCMPQIRS